jgi:hypothetical protein
MKVMKEMLTEQIKGLNEILDTAKFNLVQKIDTAFKETFKLEGIEYSKLNVYRERAEFNCDGKWGGDVTLYYHETYDESTPKLEMSIPSFRDTEFSRVILYGKIAQQAKLYGEEFISKLQVLKAEYRAGIMVVQDKLSEATRALRLVEQEEFNTDFKLIKTALETVGRTFEKNRWIQVDAKNSIHTNNIRIEKTPGKKTYTVFYTSYDRPNSWSRVREMYIDKLVKDLVYTDRNNA